MFVEFSDKHQLVPEIAFEQSARVAFRSCSRVFDGSEAVRTLLYLGQNNGESGDIGKANAARIRGREVCMWTGGGGGGGSEKDTVYHCEIFPRFQIRSISCEVCVRVG